MDQPKITKLLCLMKLLTGNVSRTIDALALEMHTTPQTIYRYIDNPANAANVEALAEGYFRPAIFDDRLKALYDRIFGDKNLKP